MPTSGSRMRMRCMRSCGLGALRLPVRLRTPLTVVEISTCKIIQVISFASDKIWKDKTRRQTLTTEVSMIVNRSAPRATVAPILVYEDVEKAIEWLCDTFGFTER